MVNEPWVDSLYKYFKKNSVIFSFYLIVCIGFLKCCVSSSLRKICIYSYLFHEHVIFMFSEKFAIPFFNLPYTCLNIFICLIKLSLVF